MKIKTAAFALLLLAGTAPAALAQEQSQGGRPHDNRGGDARPPGETRHDRGGAGGPGGVWRQPAPQQAPAPGAPPQAHPAPAPPQAPPGDHVPRGGRWQGQPGGDGRQVQPRPGRDGGDPGQGQGPGQPPSPQDRQRWGDAHRFQGGQPDQGRPDRPWEGDRRSGDGPRGDHQGDRGADHRGDGDHRNDGTWNRYDRRGDWNGDRDGRRQWRPGAYPHSFNSANRYHVRPYIRPPHFYSRIWTFGEILPPAWYGPDYVIDDWWNYGLPDPPPGYDWVRVGNDALLIDDYSGRIVQVVRDLFW